MAKDIEEFLKMAAQRRRESATGPPRAQQTPAQQKPPSKQQQKKPVKPPVVVSETEVDVVPPRRESVASGVQKNLDNSRLKRHAEKLGEEVGLADDKLDARLHQKFDHQVGHLASQAIGGVESTSKARVPVKSKTLLLNMLASPQSVQQAIIMSEILSRPEWD